MLLSSIFHSVLTQLSSPNGSRTPSSPPSLSVTTHFFCVSHLTALLQSVTVCRQRRPAQQTGRERFPDLVLPPWPRLQLRTGNLRVAIVTQPKPLPDPTQTDTYTPLHPIPKHTHTHHHPTPCAFSPQLSPASSALIGLTGAGSPHLLVAIGSRPFPFLDGRGQGTLGYRVLKSHSTCSAARVADYESQLCLPPLPPPSISKPVLT